MMPSIRQHVQRTSLPVLLFALWPALAGLALEQDPVVTCPTGEYQQARLLLAGAWQGKDLPLLLGLRDGKGASVWYCAPPRADATSSSVGRRMARSPT